jgi:transposase-like protein
MTRVKYDAAYYERMDSQRVLNKNTIRQFVESLSPERKKSCDLCQSRPGRIVDHDHVTGIIRGWVCHSCNSNLISVDRISYKGGSRKDISKRIVELVMKWEMKRDNHFAEYERALYRSNVYRSMENYLFGGQGK